MPITVGGTTITFNDATTQSTAAGALTTASVLSTTAGATARAVGTYCTGFINTAAGVPIGNTVAGSTLLGITGDGGFFNPALLGTWRNMGAGTGGFNGIISFTSWLRIS